jgi:hypothetical protein
MANNDLQMPNLLAPAEEKEKKEYGLKYAKYIHSFYKKYGSRDMFYNAREEYRRNIQYAQGNQSIDQYKKRMNIWDTKDSSWVNLDWSVRNYATKRVNVAIDMLMSEQYEPGFNAVDPIAINQKKELKAKMKAFMENKKFIESLGIATNFVPEEFRDKLPQFSDELEVNMNMDYKHRYEMEMEVGVSLCLEANNYDQIKKEMAYDFVVLGPSALRCELDSNGFPKIIYIDPSKLIVPFSKYEDFRDITFAGHLDEISIHDLRQLAGRQFSDDEYQDIHHRYNSSRLDDDDQVKDTYGTSPESPKIKVMHFSFLSDNEDVFERNQDRYGNTKFRKLKDNNRGTGKGFEDKVNESGVPYRDNGKYQVFRERYKVVYEGYWIVGSDYVFNYGLKTNMEVNKFNLTETRLPYHIFAPIMKNGKVVSLMHQMRPKLDDIQHIVLRIQHTIASAVPKGIKINMEALANANVAGAGGKRLEPMELLKLYFQRGIMFYSDTDASGMPGANKPIEEMENGMAGDIAYHMQLLQQELIALDEIIGTNQITAASTPHPDMLKGVADLSVQATKTAFGGLFHAQRSIYSSLCKSLATLYVDSVENGSAQIMAEALGASSLAFIADNSELGLHNYGFKLETLPSSQEWQLFYQDLAKASERGTIMPSDLIFIRKIKNLKQAEQVFLVRERKRSEEAAAKAQQDMEMNAQIQAQSNKLATDNQMMLLEKEKETKVAIIEMEMKKLMLEYELKSKLEEQKIAMGGVIKSGHIDQEGENQLKVTAVKAQADMAKTVLNNETKPKPKPATAK